MIAPSKHARKTSKKDYEGHAWLMDLQYFEGPILSLFKGNHRQDLFYYWCDSTNDINRWMLIRASRHDISSYLSSTKSLFAIIEDRENVHFIDTSADGDITGSWVVATNALPEKYLPGEESFFDPKLAPKDCSLSEPKPFEINIDNRWYLNEFGIFERKYSQLYSFLYPLINSKTNSNEEKLFNIYNNFPWKGGFSSVHFFEALRKIIPSFHELQIQEIQYASPGYIQLSLDTLVANKLTHILVATYENKAHLKERYEDSIKFLANNEARKAPSLEALEMLPTETKSEAIQRATELSNIIGLNKLKLTIQDLPQNPVVHLKIIQAVCRRLFSLHDFMNDNHIRLGQPSSPIDSEDE